MLLTCCLYNGTEVDQLVAFFTVHEVGKPLGPGILKVDENLNQLDVVLELWVHNLNVLLVLFE